MTATNGPGGSAIIPAKLGRYELDKEPVGEGSAGLVYKARDPGLPGVLAIKVLAPHHLPEIDMRDRFIGEAHLLRQVRSRGVVQIHAVDEHVDEVSGESFPYFVMEFCDGGTLAERVKKLGRPLTLDEGQGLIDALATALGPLHKARPEHPSGVVHRDLKPSNFLIRRSATQQRGEPIGDLLDVKEEIVVADFGLAKIVDRQASQSRVPPGPWDGALLSSSTSILGFLRQPTSTPQAQWSYGR